MSLEAALAEATAAFKENTAALQALLALGGKAASSAASAPAEGEKRGRGRPAKDKTDDVGSGSDTTSGDLVARLEAAQASALAWLKEFPKVVEGTTDLVDGEFEARRGKLGEALKKIGAGKIGEIKTAEDADRFDAWLDKIKQKGRLTPAPKPEPAAAEDEDDDI